jgi:hypothetical protein
VSELVKQLKINNPDLSIAEIEGILYVIKNNSGLTNNELIRLTGIPKETLKKFKSFLSNRLEDTEGEKVLANPDFSEELKKLDLSPYKWSLLNYENKELEAKLKEIRIKYKLEPKRDLDQFFATEKTSISKALIMSDRGRFQTRTLPCLRR